MEAYPVGPYAWSSLTQMFGQDVYDEADHLPVPPQTGALLCSH